MRLGRVSILFPRSRLDQHAQKALDGAVLHANRGQLAIDHGEAGQNRCDSGGEEPAVDVGHRRVEDPDHCRAAEGHPEYQVDHAGHVDRVGGLVAELETLDVGLVVPQTLFAVLVRWDHGTSAINLTAQSKKVNILAKKYIYTRKILLNGIT